MDLGNLFFGFSGRIGRAAYWMTALVFAVVSLFAVSPVWLVVFDPNGNVTEAFVVIGLVALVMLAIFLSSIAVGIKRLHDRNKSGWWMLFFYVLPSVLVVAAELSGDPATITFGTYTSAAIGLWAFVELGLLRGTEGPNEFGPDPHYA